MTRRARSLSVLTILVAGAVGLIAATQTWLLVALSGESSEALVVSGAQAIPLLSPLSLAALALGAVLSIIGRALRYVFGALSIVIGVALSVLTIAVITGPPVSAYATVVTDHTGIAGDSSVAALVAAVELTPWPVVSLVAWVLLVVAGAFVLATAHTWSAGGKRYRAAATSSTQHTGPLDAVDSWDDLTRGDDPTR